MNEIAKLASAVDAAAIRHLMAKLEAGTMTQADYKLARDLFKDHGVCLKPNPGSPGGNPKPPRRRRRPGKDVPAALEQRLTRRPQR